MHTAYRSWELSSHCANDDGITAQCIDCHLPSKDRFFVHLAAKAYFGAKDVYKHHFGETYDAEKKRQEVLARMPNSRCLDCHDNLLAKPSSSAARLAHKTVLGFATDPEQRCVDCHDKLHEREKEIFTAALRE
jgi:nitrate/TMAO reductase-like tetraheme cytochrome c subunit